MSNEKIPKASLGAIFSVSCVWFASHAGGGFATGNQATQYYVQYGWYAPIMAVLSMILLGLVMREFMILYNTRGCKNYKELFYALYHPYDKIEILFEIYFFLIVISAVSAAIAGAATLFTGFGIPYAVSVLIVGATTLILVIFGANLVARASTVMSIIILICSATIFITGISAGIEGIKAAPSTIPTGNVGYSLWRVVVYAGFQSVVIPAFCSCSTSIKSAKNLTKAATIGIILNGAALGLSTLMLLGWYTQYAGTENAALPAIFVCRQVGLPILTVFYSIALFLCFISTAVTSIYGLIPRFESVGPLKNAIGNITARRGLIALLAIVVSMGFAMIGLSGVIKYGYGYCGILGTFIIVIPGLIVGHIKNKKFLAEHPEWIGE